jgi:uncharacterized membrane protein YozB (DUF420 family)
MASGEAAIAAASVLLKRRRFVAFHWADRNFFLIFLLICWVGVIMGFAPAVALRWNGHARFVAPLILKVHAVAFSAWLVLLTAQVLLVRAKHTALHMKLGLAAFALAPVMVVSGYFSEVYTQRWHVAHPPNNFQFFILPIFWMLSFGALATAALVARKNPAAHKRLIVLATTVIVGAAYDRWWGDALTAAFGDGLGGMLINEFGATDLILFGALAYDFFTRGRVHKVYEIAVPLILLLQVATTIIYHSAMWLPIASFLVGS